MKRWNWMVLLMMAALLLTACGAGPVTEEEPAATTQGGEAQSAEDPLTAFRERMSPPVMAVAYLDPVEQGAADPVLSRIRETYPEWFSRHPFLEDIPEARIVGSWGDLVCVVPRVADVTVTVSRVIPAQTLAYPVEEILYTGRTGDPLLVFYGTDEDTAVSITLLDRQGRGVEWSPEWGILRTIPEDSPAGLVMDFTPDSEKTICQMYLDAGWVPPGPLELLDSFWLSWNGYALELKDDSVPADTAGEAMLYDVGPIGEYTLSYTGSWRYENGMLHLSLVPEFADGYLVDDSFPVLIRDGVLWIGRNEYGNALPHFYADQLSDTLEQPKG